MMPFIDVWQPHHHFPQFHQLFPSQDGVMLHIPQFQLGEVNHYKPNFLVSRAIYITAENIFLDVHFHTDQRT